MDSSHTTLLANLLVFNNTLQPELMRSVHVYRQGNGEEREVEREFVFSESDSYGEMQATPILRLMKYHVSEVNEGYQNGVWLCILRFMPITHLNFPTFHPFCWSQETQSFK
ncbi:RKD5 protein [Spatholobus suberectus]|nr:RKD5 protein [Spatholobus suberectus]